MFSSTVSKKTFFIGALTLLTINGCASLVEGSKQEVAIQTVHNGSQVFNSRCHIKNNESEKSVITPGRVLIEKSTSYLEITCKKTGLPDGSIKAESGTGVAVFGNILFGGLIGAGIDMGSGSAYRYQNAIVVKMGENIHLNADSESDKNTTQ